MKFNLFLLIFNILTLSHLPYAGETPVDTNKTHSFNNSYNYGKPNAEMLRRINAPSDLQCKEPSFKVGVIDLGEIYQHPNLNNIEPIHPLPPTLSSNEEHGLMVCSVIHQLHPLVKISYYMCGSIDFSENIIIENIKKAINDPLIKIINCSFNVNFNNETNIINFKKSLEIAQQAGKLFVFASGNYDGWFGLSLKNNIFFELSINEKTNKSFVLIGSSKEQKHQEYIDYNVLKAGALRKHFLIAPGANITVMSHVPKRNSQKSFSGTSAAAPTVVATLVHLMCANPTLTPYQAWRQLCENASPPRQLTYASGTDQGWGYLNLEKALINRRENTLRSSPFTQAYDIHMQREYSVDVHEILNKNYSKSIIPILEKLDVKSPPVKQLLRVALYEEGIYLLARRKFSSSSSSLNDLNELTKQGAMYLEKAKNLGINHYDPLASFISKERLLNSYRPAEIPDLKWHQAMIATGHEYRQVQEMRKFPQESCQVLKKALQNGYTFAMYMIESYINVHFIETNVHSTRDILGFLNDFNIDLLSSESKKQIENGLVSIATHLLIENQIENVEHINNLAQLIVTFFPEKTPLSIQLKRKYFEEKNKK